MGTDFTRVSKLIALGAKTCGTIYNLLPERAFEEGKQVPTYILEKIGSILDDVRFKRV